MASLGLEKLSTAGKVGAASIFMILLGVVYYVIFYGELDTKIEGARREESTLQGELAEARQTEALYQKDLSELTERQQRQSRLAKVLPSSTEYPAFLSSIQNVANVAGVALTAWSPSQEQIEKFYARVPMRLSVEGRFHQIAKFFYGIGQLDRIINMENIAMQDPRLVDNDIVLKVTALATAFRTLAPTETAQGKRGPGGAAQ